MKKHIAYLCADPGIPVYGNKGASIHVQNIIRAFIRAGHRVTLFANRIDGTPPPGLETVHLVPLSAPPKGDNETRARAILAAHDTITAAIAAHAPYDLLYERYSLWSDIGMRYAEAAGIPSVLEVNAPLIDEQRTHRELVLPAEAETIAKSAFSRARELIAVSPGVAAYLKNWPHRRITTLANGVQPHTSAAALPIRADPSHIGGRRELIAPLCQQAMDLGFDGLIVETHHTPDQAWSDAQQQVTPDRLDVILSHLVVRDKQQTVEAIDQLRRQIDDLDNQLIELLSNRMRICREIGRYKREHNITVFQASRYNEILEKRGAQATRCDMSAEFVATVFENVHQESVRQQMKIINQ